MNRRYRVKDYDLTKKLSAISKKRPHKLVIFMGSFNNNGYNYFMRFFYYSSYRTKRHYIRQ